MTNGLTRPSERFIQEIEPALAEYNKGPLSERLANNLARAVDHHLDWTFDYYRKVDPSRLNGAGDEKSFRRQLLQQCSQLQIMNDLSDAAHHRFLTRPNNPSRIVDTSTVTAGAWLPHPLRMKVTTSAISWSEYCCRNCGMR